MLIMMEFHVIFHDYYNNPVLVNNFGLLYSLNAIIISIHSFQTIRTIRAIMYRLVSNYLKTFSFPVQQKNRNIQPIIRK